MAPRWRRLYDIALEPEPEPGLEPGPEPEPEPGFNGILEGLYMASVEQLYEPLCSHKEDEAVCVEVLHELILEHRHGAMLDHAHTGDSLTAILDVARYYHASAGPVLELCFNAMCLHTTGAVPEDNRIVVAMHGGLELLAGAVARHQANPNVVKSAVSLLLTLVDDEGRDDNPQDTTPSRCLLIRYVIQQKLVMLIGARSMTISLVECVKQVATASLNQGYNGEAEVDEDALKTLSERFTECMAESIPDERFVDWAAALRDRVHLEMADGTCDNLQAQGNQMFKDGTTEGVETAHKLYDAALAVSF